MKLYSPVADFKRDLPPGLDPEQHPILLQHWYGVDPAALRRSRETETPFIVETAA